jgi:hypothetical protein
VGSGILVACGVTFGRPPSLLDLKEVSACCRAARHLWGLGPPVVAGPAGRSPVRSLFKRPDCSATAFGAGRGPGMPSLLEDNRPGLVVEVLYVEHCPNFPVALALVERVAADLGVDTEVQPTLISDQAAAERTRFVGSPRCGSTAAMSIPKASWPPSTPRSVACTGMSIAWPATPRSAWSVMPCCGQPVRPDGR